MILFRHGFLLREREGEEGREKEGGREVVLQWHCDSVSGSGLQVSHLRTGLRKEAVQLRQTVGGIILGLV